MSSVTYVTEWMNKHETQKKQWEDIVMPYFKILLCVLCVGFTRDYNLMNIQRSNLSLCIIADSRNFHLQVEV